MSRYNSKTWTRYFGICPACRLRAEGHPEDFGIGAYEYWGARGTQHDWQIVSDCCGEIMEDVETYEDEPEYDPVERRGE